jgi:hypothetical protein
LRGIHQAWVGLEKSILGHLVKPFWANGTSIGFKHEKSREKGGFTPSIPYLTREENHERVKAH